ncbi:MAG: prepilin-type N-terminal cleavage/methylation domain-containing protein [bacterium]|nr:prepilin-type N-terminal cleavage/methylation domain-containing protein [bacterium]
MGDRRGFTLLEVLVSLAILSITLLLAYQVLSGAIDAEDRSERWTVASCLGETLVRESTAAWPEIGESSGTFEAPMAAYAWKRSIRPAAHPDAREVHVTVTWSAGDRKESVSLAGVAVK